MAEALQFEKVDEDGNPDKHYLGSTSRKPRKAKRPRVDSGLAATLGSSDKDDPDFEESESDSTSGNDSDGILPSNAEVFHFVNRFLQVTNMFMQGCRNSPF